ncbi:hypothetical protein C8Q80DRAFT_1231308 [Daedaleopsis nitida]|nr:hypothetical protein C8Q80DRAFT_1231308 [Daedaleopsis nitida]
MLPGDEYILIPDWVKDHPEIKARGYQLRMVLKPNVAWRTTGHTPPYVVKVLNPAGQEANIYEQLRRLSPASPNHTLPGSEVIPGERPLLVLPAVNEFMPSFSTWDLKQLLQCYYQILEGVEFLHEQKIAHLDFVTNNLLLVDERHLKYHPDLPLEVNKIYIMDFGESQQLELGPGRQPAIKLPPSHIAPPNGMTHLDPYSWDVHCVGHAFQWISEWVHSKRPEPWIVRRLGLWLVGNERGCTATVCHCRPTARRARQVLSVILWAVGILEAFRRASSALRREVFCSRATSSRKEF